MVFAYRTESAMVHICALCFLAISATASLPVTVGQEVVWCDVEEGLDCVSEELLLLQTKMRVVPSSLSRSSALPQQSKASASWTSVAQTETLLGISETKVHSKEAASATARALAWLQRLSSGQNAALLQVVSIQEQGAHVAVVFVLLVVLCLVWMVVFEMLKKNHEKWNPLQQHGGAAGSNLIAERDPRLSLVPPTSKSPFGIEPLSSAESLSKESLRPLSDTRLPTPTDAALQASKQLEAVKSVPPICPSLILPKSEAVFLVPLNSLLRFSKGSLDLTGASGTKLLSALVCDSPDGRHCLMLASCGCEDDPRTTIFTPPPGPTLEAPKLEVFGKGGKFYGWLDPPAFRDRSTLSYSGSDGKEQEVMQIQWQTEDPLRLQASTMDGHPLASASRGDSGFWCVRVKPGVDAVLISSVMLALMILRPH